MTGTGQASGGRCGPVLMDAFGSRTATPLRGVTRFLPAVAGFLMEK